MKTQPSGLEPTPPAGTQVNIQVNQGEPIEESVGDAIGIAEAQAAIDDAGKGNGEGGAS